MGNQKGRFLKKNLKKVFTGKHIQQIIQIELNIQIIRLLGNSKKNIYLGNFFGSNMVTFIIQNSSKDKETVYRDTWSRNSITLTDFVKFLLKNAFWAKV